MWAKCRVLGLSLHNTIAALHQLKPEKKAHLKNTQIILSFMGHQALHDGGLKLNMKSSCTSQTSIEETLQCIILSFQNKLWDNKNAFITVICRHLDTILQQKKKQKKNTVLQGYWSNHKQFIVIWQQFRLLLCFSQQSKQHYSQTKTSYWTTVRCCTQTRVILQ